MTYQETLTVDDTYRDDVGTCDHTYERINPFTGHWQTVNGVCDCTIVDTGIVNGRQRFSVKTTGSDFDDLPF